jgi:hypothetical protein
MGFASQFGEPAFSRMRSTRDGNTLRPSITTGSLMQFGFGTSRSPSSGGSGLSP